MKDDQRIEDVYVHIMEDLKSFIDKEDLPESFVKLFNKFIDRKLVKSIFMPIIYGKTQMSTAEDIKMALKPYFYPAFKESFLLASPCFKFWREYYTEMENLIRLIRLVGWFASTCESSVHYVTPFFCTSQNYMVKDSHIIWVYDKVNRKKRKVTLRLSSRDKRDRKKTEVSTFVNFIHQKDALIAMGVISKLYEVNEPIYTVHENFISNPLVSVHLPYIYLEVLRELGPPLRFINSFIYENLVRLAKDRGDDKEILGLEEKRFTEMVLTEDLIDQLFACILPETIKMDKEKLKVWRANISRFKTFYFGYTRFVCGEDPSSGSKDMKWNDHVIKWEKFSSRLNGQYCLHH
uniref:DNA-directed RNA polymerase n=1 Tax=Beta vulgaris subsp. maritima TaxID=350892 RepID=F4ML87_BETVM|nr:hypothetical protein [Beta vulgaris subsp. maritima]